MFIELESLFNGGIDSIPVNCEFDFSKEEFSGVFPFTTPVKLCGEIRNTAGVVTISAVINFDIEIVCDRCAEDAKLEFEVPMEHGLVSELNDEENDDYILVENMKLDIAELTLEDIYLALPAKLLCKEDCMGVCPTCGANLNEGPCNCKKEIDPRLEALLDLLGD
ncbi:MAG: DUF177 domain-containing protein [Acutalibacteraceae bacterium]|nr:DUF177 domain-containing protein [Acutalibacteraceae bacterium]